METMLRQSLTLVYQHGSSLKAFSIYLEEKAAHLKAWRGGMESDSMSAQRGPQPWKDIPIVEQFFAVLVHLRWGLTSQFVSGLLGMPAVSYSRMF